MFENYEEKKKEKKKQESKVFDNSKKMTCDHLGTYSIMWFKIIFVAQVLDKFLIIPKTMT